MRVGSADMIRRHPVPMAEVAELVNLGNPGSRSGSDACSPTGIHLGQCPMGPHR